MASLMGRVGMPFVVLWVRMDRNAEGLEDVADAVAGWLVSLRSEAQKAIQTSTLPSSLFSAYELTE